MGEWNSVKGQAPLSPEPQFPFLSFPDSPGKVEPCSDATHSQSIAQTGRPHSQANSQTRGRGRQLGQGQGKGQLGKVEAPAGQSPNGHTPQNHTSHALDPQE